MAAKTILVVDDSPIVRRQMTMFLENQGFSVVDADCGKAGLAAAADHRPSLILLDVAMPGMSGIEMLRELRQRGDDTPAFVLTTQTSKSLLREGREAGALAWMVKPFNPDALLKGIRSVLGKS